LIFFKDDDSEGTITATNIPFSFVTWMGVEPPLEQKGKNQWGSA
jgi:hypothetical protein